MVLVEWLGKANIGSDMLESRSGIQVFFLVLFLYWLCGSTFWDDLLQNERTTFTKEFQPTDRVLFLGYPRNHDQKVTIPEREG